MRLASIGGRAAVDIDGSWHDLAKASAGAFGPDIQDVYDDWAALVAWHATASAGPDSAVDPAAGFGIVAPRPRQVFAIGLNYRDHAAESNFEVPEGLPPTFTKYVSSFAADGDDVVLVSDSCDWEVELVAVIGRQAHDVPADEAWEYVAGLTIGQDISERVVQLKPPAPQFGLGKSFPGFSPIGPVVVTPDEVPDRDDLELGCWLDGEQLQLGRTKEMVFSVPELVSRISAVVTLLPGDVIFTGTPAGVGAGRKPPRFLTPGALVSRIEGIGELTVNLVPKGRS